MKHLILTCRWFICLGSFINKKWVYFHGISLLFQFSALDHNAILFLQNPPTFPRILLFFYVHFFYCLSFKRFDEQCTIASWDRAIQGDNFTEIYHNLGQSNHLNFPQLYSLKMILPSYWMGGYHFASLSAQMHSKVKILDWASLIERSATSNQFCLLWS